LSRRVRSGERISLGFTADTAARTGLSRRTIQHELQIGTMPATVREAAAKAPKLADCKTDLLVLARIAAVDEQLAVTLAEKVASGEARNLQQAINDSPVLPRRPPRRATRQLASSHLLDGRRGGLSPRTERPPAPPAEGERMKTLDTETQAGIFAAGTAAAAVLKRRAPDAVRELAGLGFVIAACAPTYEHLEEWQRSAGLPPIDQASYEEALAAAVDFANLTFATDGQKEH